ncbi:MAG: AcrR family transcriptional regulator [Cognaticolwellia sp.]
MPRISKEEKAKVREALLASAANHFAAHGLAGANIDQISLDAGFAKGTVYNYFPSKRALFGAVLTAASLATVQHAERLVTSGGARQQLRALAEADVALVRRHPNVMKALLREILAPNGADPDVLASLVPLLKRASGILEQGQREGQVRDDVSAAQLAQVFLGQLSMAYLQHWSGVGLPWEDMAERVTLLFFEGAGCAHGASIASFKTA